MSNRECGACTACCQGWLTAEALDMRPGRACRHCTSHGCAIYEDRPEDPCVRFSCGWLLDPAQFPDDMRPDRSGVIVLLGRKWRDWSVLYAVPAGKDVPPESLERLRLIAKQQQIPLVFFERIVKDGEYSGRKVLGLGPPAFANDVKNGIGPEDVVRM